MVGHYYPDQINNNHRPTSKQLQRLIDISNICKQSSNHDDGSMECSGNKLLEVTESCQSLREAGHQASGYYLTSTEDGNHIDVTYCNMKLDAEEDGFQIDTLARLTKTMVAFDAYRTSTDYSMGDTVIPYDEFIMQIGGGMDLSTGIFTAPIAGIYSFTGTWLDSYTTSVGDVLIRKNGSVIGNAHSYEQTVGSFGITVLVSLVEGDTVDTYLDGGAITSSSLYKYAHFTGNLIYPM
jgi:hypothetical protein